MSNNETNFHPSKTSSNEATKEMVKDTVIRLFFQSKLNGLSNEDTFLEIQKIYQGLEYNPTQK